MSENKSTNWITPVALGVVLVALLVGALLLYNRLEGTTGSTTPATGASSDTTATTSAEATPAAGTGDTGIPGVNTTATEAVPDFTMTNANGVPVTLSSLKGKPTIMNFWATWCPPCREELDSFQKMYDKYGTQVNFVMLNIVSQGDTMTSVQKFCADKGYTFPLYFDVSGEGTTLFGVTGIPETVFLDAKGLSYGKVVGGMPESMVVAGMKVLTGSK